MEATGGTGRVAVVLAVLLVVPVVPVGAAGTQVDAEATLVPHPPISIQGDDGFDDPLSGVREGTGTEADPYVISNWTVPSVRGNAIDIRDTRAHVVLRDVYVPGGRLTFNGVLFSNATNVTVENVYIRQAVGGLTIIDGANVEVNRVRIMQQETDLAPADAAGFSNDGLGVFRSTDVSLQNLTIGTTRQPLDIQDSERVAVANSTFLPDVRTLGSFKTAIELQDNENISMYGNLLQKVEVSLEETNRNLSFVSNLFDGFYDRHSPEDSIESFLGERGIESFGTVGDTVGICGNQFVNMGSAAIVLSGKNLTVKANEFNSTIGALDLSGSDLRIEHNLFQDHEVLGMVLNAPTAQDAHLHNNSFVDTDTAVKFVGKADARWNWWDDATGPSGDGPGEGSAIELGSVTLGDDVLVDPWLTSPPTTGPGAVGCGMPLIEPGAKATADLNVSGAVHGSAHVDLNERVGPAHLKLGVDVGVEAAFGPFPFPERTPPPLHGSS